MQDGGRDRAAELDYFFVPRAAAGAAQASTQAAEAAGATGETVEDLTQKVKDEELMTMVEAKGRG